MRKLAGAGTIDKSVAVAHEAGGSGGEADAHLVTARFRAGIADRSSKFDTAGATDGAGARHYRFQQSGFTALERAHQRNAPWTAGTSDVMSHCRLLCGARPMIGSATVYALPPSEIWQGKKSLRRIDQRIVPPSDGGTSIYRNQRPGRSSRLSSPAATLKPTWPC